MSNRFFTLANSDEKHLAYNTENIPTAVNHTTLHTDDT